MPDLNPACLNCSAPFSESATSPAPAFCPVCGQENQPRVLPFSTVVREACAEFVQIDGKLARTFWALLFRPGFLTAEFLRGRRVAYLSPLKMYLFTSATFFLIASLIFPVSGNDIENYLGRRVSVKQTGSRHAAALAFPAPAPAAVPDMPRDKSEWVSVPPFPFAGQTIDIKNLSNSVLEYREAQDKRAKKGLSTDSVIVQAVKRKLIRLRESPGDALRAIVVGTLSNMTLIAVPLLALFMLPLYLRWNRRLYIEHFVFQLHCHTFFFVVLILICLLSPLLPVSWENYGILPLLWLPIYGVLALRRVYGQSLGKSLLKSFLMLNVYGTILALAAVLGVLVTLISILITL